MFPMIPAHLTAGSARKVTALTDLPRHSETAEFSVSSLMQDRPKNTKTGVWFDGESVSGGASWWWVREVRLAGDCHSCNCLLQRARHDTALLQLQMVKQVAAGEELLLWFTQALLMELDIPFLTPANIQGDALYVCHRCSARFESPNPLKVHLSLRCAPLDAAKLFAKLETRASAFQPIRHWQLHAPQIKMESPVSRLGALTVLQHAAHMEALVSELGRSKQGHLCIYCGKLYSRKYGLKIHIRTHTGFKPLQCKYCLRPFGDPSNLNKHVRLHADGATPYKCDVCGKVLVRRRDLERHINSRHPPTSTSSTDILRHPSNDIQ